MTRSLPYEKWNSLIFLLQKEWSIHKVAKWLAISQFSVYRIQKKGLFDAKLYVGGRPKVVLDHLKRACVRVVTIGGISTTKEASKLFRQKFVNEISIQII